jgi:hypothetical protein
MDKDASLELLNSTQTEREKNKTVEQDPKKKRRNHISYKHKKIK